MREEDDEKETERKRVKKRGKAFLVKAEVISITNLINGIHK